METIEQREQRIAELAEARAMRRAGEARTVASGERRMLTTDDLPEAMLTRSAAGPVITTRNALTVPAAWACVRALVDAASSLPLHVFTKGDRGRVRADTSAAAQLLRHPAPGVTQPAFLGHLMTSLQLHGEAFVAKYRDQDNRVTQLGLFDPTLVQVEVVGGLPTYTVTLNDGLRSRVQTLTPSDVIHVRGPLTLDGVRGASPVKVAREAFGYAAALVDYGSRTFANSATPRGILHLEEGGPHEEEQLANLARDFEARHRGTANAGRLGLLSRAVKFTPIQMTNADAEWLGSCRFSDAQIAQVFRVPPWVIGADTGSSLTYSTVSEQLRAFVMFSLRPWLVSIEAAFNADRELFPGGLYCLHELDALLRADPSARAQTYTAALHPETGWMRRDEVRALEDLPAERQEATANA